MKHKVCFFDPFCLRLGNPLIIVASVFKGVENEFAETDEDAEERMQNNCMTDRTPHSERDEGQSYQSEEERRK